MALDYIQRVAGPYSGAGTTDLPFSFYCYDEGDIGVVLAASDASLDYSVLVNGTDFTVTLNDDQGSSPGGTVTLAAALADDLAVAVVFSTMEYTQETELTNYSRFPPSIINDALDRIVVQTQQLFEAVGRCIKLPLTYAARPEEFMKIISDIRDEAAQAKENAANSADEAAGYAEAAAASATEAASSATEAAGSADSAASAAESIAYIADFPHIVETLDDVTADTDNEKGYYWVTGVTSETGSTATTLAENIDSINTLVENLETLVYLVENAEALIAVDTSLLGIDDLTTIFEAGLSS